MRGLKLTPPKDFAEAMGALGDKLSVHLAHATTLRRVIVSTAGGKQVRAAAMWHHETAIVIWMPDGRIVIDTGGYASSTTLDRIDMVVKRTGKRVGRRGGRAQLRNERGQMLAEGWSKLEIRPDGWINVVE